MSGKVFAARLLWQALTTDKWIHDVVNGKILEFDKLPMQTDLDR